MISAFGIDHGHISKAEGPADLGAFREKKRKAEVQAFFDRPDIKSKIDEFARPAPHKKFSDDAGGGVHVNYRRPDGSVTSPAPRAVKASPKTLKRSGKGLMIAGGALAAASATPAIVGAHRKKTRARRKP